MPSMTKLWRQFQSAVYFFVLSSYAVYNWVILEVLVIFAYYCAAMINGNSMGCLVSCKMSHFDHFLHYTVENKQSSFGWRNVYIHVFGMYIVAYAHTLHLCKKMTAYRCTHVRRSSVGFHSTSATLFKQLMTICLQFHAQKVLSSGLTARRKRVGPIEKFPAQCAKRLSDESLKSLCCAVGGLGLSTAMGEFSETKLYSDHVKATKIAGCLSQSCLSLVC